MTRSVPYPIGPLDRSGVLKDLSPEQIPDGSWQDGKNVRFIDGRVKALFGYQRFFASALQNDASKRIMHGGQFALQNATVYLIVMTLTKIYQWVTGTSSFSDISGSFSFSGNSDSLFMTEAGFNLFLICNGIDPAKKWSGSGNIGTLGGLSTAAPLGGAVIPHLIRAYANFLVAINNIEDGGTVPFRIRWGKIGQAEVWANDINGVGQAGYNDLNDTPSPALNALQLGNSLAIYKTDGIYLMTYVGLPAVFSFYKAVYGKGLLAPRAVVSMGPYHLFLADDNFYAFDGAQARPIATDKIKDYFIGDLNPQYSNRVQAMLFNQYGEVWWAYTSLSSSGDFDKVLIYNYLRNTWTFASFTASALFLYTLQSSYTWANQPDLLWNVVPGRWNDIQLVANSPLLLIGNASSIVFQHGLVYNQDGAAYTKQAVSKLYDFKKPGVHKRLQKVQFSVDQLGLTNLKIYVGTTDHPSNAISWSGPYAMQTGKGQPYITCDLTAVYFAFRFESVGINDAWEIMSFTPWTLDRSRQ